MGLSIAIDRPGDLPLITHVIHDCWFDKEEIRCNESLSALEIRFTRRHQTEPTTAHSVSSTSKADPLQASYSLWIDHVERYEIRDSEQVGRYDFNKLVYEPKEREIVILTGIPIDIRIKVTRFGVRVEEAGPSALS